MMKSYTNLCLRPTLLFSADSRYTRYTNLRKYITRCSEENVGERAKRFMDDVWRNLRKMLIEEEQWLKWDSSAMRAEECGGAT